MHDQDEGAGRANRDDTYPRDPRKNVRESYPYTAKLEWRRGRWAQGMLRTRNGVT